MGLLWDRPLGQSDSGYRQELINGQDSRLVRRRQDELRREPVAIRRRRQGRHVLHHRTQR